jgi:hypothetical protein
MLFNNHTNPRRVNQKIEVQQRYSHINPNPKRPLEKSDSQALPLKSHTTQFQMISNSELSVGASNLDTSTVMMIISYKNKKLWIT